MALPHVGDIVVLTDTVGMVVGRNDRKRGAVLTVMHGGGGLAHRIETRPLTRLPDGWRIVSGAAAHNLITKDN
ncbi:MAG: hypothetical protein BWY85_00458 [Firmicutes bacterium ADurb.Bin506]|nr:MAG: hypothetical protein BWY85_00458 [Firmicutes bacterium ADurb.Bin506]